MAARQDEIKAVLADPEFVYRSTVSNAALVFEATTASSVQIRVVATYDDMTGYKTGTTTAKMNTTFPVDEVLYDKPQIDFESPVYVKPKLASNVPDGEGGERI